MSAKTTALPVGARVTARTPLNGIEFTTEVLGVHVAPGMPVAYLVAWGDGPNARVWTSKVRKAA